MKPSDNPAHQVPSIQEVQSNDYFQPYVATLKKVFAEILGWSEVQTMTYIQQKLQHDWFRSWFGHNTPCDDAASVIVPAALRTRLIAQRISTVHIHKEIETALQMRGDTCIIHPDTDPDYDWQRTKDEIANIIKKYETQAA